MELYEAMSTTRAVRRLRSDPIPDEVLRRVLTAATYGPSGGNRQSWRMLVVKQPALKERLQQLYAKPWEAYSARGRKALEALPERSRDKGLRNLDAGDYLAEHLGEVPAIVVLCFDPRGLAITDAALSRPSVVGGASIYPAVQNLLLACRSEGMGCVLTTLLCAHEDEIRPLLGLPDEWYLAAFIPIGYPVGGGHGPLSRIAVEHMTYLDRWGQTLF